ncbi:MAG TPA: glycosyltransferase family 39 protein [Chloroflexota bacterium]
MHPEDSRSSAPPLTQRVIAGALLSAAAFVYLWWEIAYRAVYQYAISQYGFDDADEWRYTACSRLVVHGYRLFDQVFSAQPPLFFLSLAGGMRLLGDSIDGARATEILFGALGLGATAWLAWELDGPFAAGLAAAFLAISPGFLVYSHAVEAEGPMMALMTLSLALVALHRRIGSRPALGFAGLALAAAILIKFFAAEALLPALLLIVQRERGRRTKAVVPAALFGLAVAVPVALDLVLVSPADQWQQVVVMHDKAATVALPDLTAPGTILREFLTLDLGLTLLAAAGLITLFALCRFPDAIVLSAWLPGMIVMLFLFRPLFPHHAAILLTGLAVSAGVGAGATVKAHVSHERKAVFPVAVALLAYLALLPRLAHADRHTLLAEQRPSVLTLAAYVQRTTSPSSFVAADDLEVADRAQRLVPAPLCDPSNVRFRSGYLTAATLISATRQYQTVLVVPSRGIYLQVPAYTAWVRAHYRPERVPRGPIVYRRP